MYGRLVLPASPGAVVDHRDVIAQEYIVSLGVFLMNLVYTCYAEGVDMLDIVLKDTKDLFSFVDIAVLEYRIPVG